MRELGEYLRQMRQNRGVSLEEVAEATKINLKYLRALEEGEYDILPPEVYVRGFLAAYADYLGIDPEELYARYEADLPKRRRRTIAPKPAAYEESARVKPSIGELWQSAKAIPVVVYVIAAVVIVVGVVLVASLGGGGSPPETVTEAVLGDTTLQRAAAAPLDEDIAQEIRITIDTVNAAQALSIAESLTFVVRAREPVNIYVEIDHIHRAFKGMMYRGQRKVWRVKNSLYFEVSNPSALRISVNGFDLAPIEVRHPQAIEINRQNVLQYIAGYQPPPPGVSSAYGQRIESGVDTVLGPPPEIVRHRRRPAKADTAKTQPKIKPPRLRLRPKNQ